MTSLTAKNFNSIPQNSKTQTPNPRKAAPQDKAFETYTDLRQNLSS
jgi:hypothetical protein